ncbi:MAG TPA: glycosyltransferase N-terminal domain-containing protein, partial [Anaerohalosphaeraceae bacterium]|nr:glycosyltransferase N-terminal domain-containing protein [Anaerohalosphaeraceae bacterium]
MQIVMNLIYCIALVLYSPKIIYRRLFENRYREGWRQRRGFIDRRCPDKPCIWIHAVSVGEVNAARTLIDELRRQMPNYEVVLSSTTDTGLARAKSQYEKDLSVFYFPLDFSWTMRRAFDRLRPALILLMELEVWPNMAAIAAKRGIPVVVVNGRLSDKSFPRYKKIRWLVQRMFGKVAFVLAQTEEYARRFIELGCQPHKVIVTSSLKYDTAQTEGPVCGADRLAQQIRLDKEPLWVAGGTGPGEEKIALNVFAKLRQDSRLAGLRLAIIPRKPERFDEVAALIEQVDFAIASYRGAIVIALPLNAFELQRLSRLGIERGE